MVNAHCTIVAEPEPGAIKHAKGLTSAPMRRLFFVRSRFFRLVVVLIPATFTSCPRRSRANRSVRNGAARHTRARTQGPRSPSTILVSMGAIRGRWSSADAIVDNKGQSFLRIRVVKSQGHLGNAGLSPNIYSERHLLGNWRGTLKTVPRMLLYGTVRRSRLKNSKPLSVISDTMPTIKNGTVPPRRLRNAE